MRVASHTHILTRTSTSCSLLVSHWGRRGSKRFRFRVLDRCCCCTCAWMSTSVRLWFLHPVVMHAHARTHAGPDCKGGLVTLGTGFGRDNEKKFCGKSELQDPTCTIISVGSHNEWGFESGAFRQVGSACCLHPERIGAECLVHRMT
jgi:hypothetical protein